MCGAAPVWKYRRAHTHPCANSCTHHDARHKRHARDNTRDSYRDSYADAFRYARAVSPDCTGGLSERSFLSGLENEPVRES